jgi:hypothetical protein
MTTVLMPYTTPQYLNETGFINFGFFTGTATNYQITSAAAIAELQVAQSIGSFPFYVTGVTVEIPFLDFQQYEMPFGNVERVNYVYFHEKYNDGATRLISGSAILNDSFYGLIRPYISNGDVSSCQCGGSSLGISHLEVNFDGGYGTGTNSPINHPQFLLASYMAMDIVVKMMYDEGIGQIYENQVKTMQAGRILYSYGTNGFLGNTVFGPSARANYIHKLLEPFRIGRAGRLSGRVQRKVRW